MRVFGTGRSLYGAPAQAIAARRRHTLQALSGLALVSVLSGCATPPPPPIPPAQIELQASPEVNPDARGRASPLTVRVYVLKTPGAFQSGDFFSLYEKDQAALGGDLLLREELLLKPGERRSIQMKLPADAKAIGVLAAYRDLNRAQWRALQSVDPGKALKIGVQLGVRQVAVDVGEIK